MTKLLQKNNESMRTGSKEKARTQEEAAAVTIKGQPGQRKKS